MFSVPVFFRLLCIKAYILHHLQKNIVFVLKVPVKSPLSHADPFRYLAQSHVGKTFLRKYIQGRIKEPVSCHLGIFLGLSRQHITSYKEKLHSELYIPMGM